jgi:Flp pilus assembly protein protease CpaA
VSEALKVVNQVEERAGGDVRSRKLWWLLPLAVLFVLVGVIYVLGHMGSADSEMYPTTERQSTVTAHLC